MGSSSGDSSPNGLAFGQKIYFGDVGLGAPAVSGGGSSSPAAKKGRGVAGSAQPPRCQVEGCNADLSDAKAYYSRHKVCCMHSKFSMVVVGGIEQRFCQQCSRFHRLAEFDYGKRSCRRRLADHNERRRKPPPGSLLSSQMGQLSSSVFDGGSRTGGFLVNFTANSNTPDSSSSWPGTKPPINHPSFTAWPGEPPAAGTNYHAGPTIPSGECFAGVTNSGCALSLLSNQHWSSGPTDLHNPGHQTLVSPFAEPSWGFKVGEASGGLLSDSGPCQVSQPPRFGDGRLDAAQPGGRQLMDFEHFRAYGSPAGHTDWSL